MTDVLALPFELDIDPQALAEAGANEPHDDAGLSWCRWIGHERIGCPLGIDESGVRVDLVDPSGRRWISPRVAFDDLARSLDRDLAAGVAPLALEGSALGLLIDLRAGGLTTSSSGWSLNRYLATHEPSERKRVGSLVVDLVDQNLLAGSLDDLHVAELAPWWDHLSGQALEIRLMLPHPFSSGGVVPPIGHLQMGPPGQRLIVVPADAGLVYLASRESGLAVGFVDAIRSLVS